MSTSVPILRSCAAVAAAVMAMSLATASPTTAGPSPGPGGPLPPVTPQLRAIELVQPATVMVRADWEIDVHAWGITIPIPYTSTCTAVIASPTGHIITAGHCVASEDARDSAIELAVDELIAEDVFDQEERADLIKLANTGRDRWTVTAADSPGAPEPEIQVQLGGGPATWSEKYDPKAGLNARVLEVLPHRKGDVALLKVEESDLPVAQFAQRNEVQVGQEVISIGYPFELAAGDVVALANRNGQISSTDTTGVHGSGNLFYETSATLTPGMSGGATTNLAGQVVGIASFVFKGESNYIVPAEVVGEVLTRHGVRNQLGPIDNLYQSGLNDFYRGYYTDAMTKFDQVLASMPAHHLAAEKRKAAAEYHQRYGDQPKPSTVAAHGDRYPYLLIGAAVLLIVLAVIAAVFRRRLGARRRSRSAGVELPAGPAIDVDGWTEDAVGRATVPIAPRCLACGHTYQLDATFCVACGTRLVGIRPPRSSADDVAPTSAQ